MKRVLPVVLAVALTTAVAAPAKAMFPVIDAGAILQLVSQVKQTIALVQTAKQNLATLGGSVSLTNIQGRISTVTGMLQQAQSLCTGALRGQRLPSACNVSASTANAQAAQLGAEMAQLQVLQGAARGVNGSLSAQQVTAQTLVELATQLQELRQQSTATVLQKQFDDRAVDQAIHGGSTIQPWK